MYIRTVNSYLSWLREEGQITTSLRVKVLRAPLHQKTLLSASDIRALMLFRPQTVIQRRTWTLICFCSIPGSESAKLWALNGLALISMG